jgi:hypothetical protein
MILYVCSLFCYNVKGYGKKYIKVILMGAFKEILKMTLRFYRHECCFPYTLSFLLVLLIYAIDFHTLEKAMLWPSII